jgi:hypothetical protein
MGFGRAAITEGGVERLRANRPDEVMQLDRESADCIEPKWTGRGEALVGLSLLIPFEHISWVESPLRNQLFPAAVTKLGVA